jgi:predicted site-specific integrase-resolvase
MEQINEQKLFTIEEVAKWCNLSRNAAYMHYRRGHLMPVKMNCHRLYFTREEVDAFRANYVPFN